MSSKKVDVNAAIETLKDDPEVMEFVRLTKNLMTVVEWSPVAVVVAAGAIWDIKVAMYVLVTWYLARYAQFRLSRMMYVGAKMVGEKMWEDK